MAISVPERRTWLPRGRSLSPRQRASVVLVMAIVLLSVTAFAALIALLCAWAVTRSVTQPLAVSLQALDRVAEGDLTVTVMVDRSDELGYARCE